MKTHLLLRWFDAGILGSTAAPMHTQLVSDGTSVTLSNITNTLTVTVGANGAFTLLRQPFC